MIGITANCTWICTKNNALATMFDNTDNANASANRNRLPNGIPEGLGERLSEVRIYVSIRGDVLRIAPHLCNDESDIERLFNVLRELT